MWRFAFVGMHIKKLITQSKKTNYPVKKKLITQSKKNYRFRFVCLPWSAGPLVLWSLVLWSAGPLVLWSPGPLVLWSPGPLVRLVLWSLVPWSGPPGRARVRLCLRFWLAYVTPILDRLCLSNEMVAIPRNWLSFVSFCC